MQGTVIRLIYDLPLDNNSLKSSGCNCFLFIVKSANTYNVCGLLSWLVQTSSAILAWAGLLLVDLWCARKWLGSLYWGQGTVSASIRESVCNVSIILIHVANMCRELITRTTGDYNESGCVDITFLVYQPKCLHCVWSTRSWRWMPSQIHRLFNSILILPESICKKWSRYCTTT